MATYDLEYAQQHLLELFESAINAEEVIVMRDDGKACELTRLASAWSPEPAAALAHQAEEPDAALGEPVPA